MPEEQCLNCLWLDLRKDYRGRGRYWCIKREQDLGESVLWRKACEDFRHCRRYG